MWLPVLGVAVGVTYQGPQHQDAFSVSPSLAYDPASPAGQNEVKATLRVYPAYVLQGCGCKSNLVSFLSQEML